MLNFDTLGYQEGEIVVRVGNRSAEANEMMHRRCLDFVIQMNCILAFHFPNVRGFKIGVNFIV